MLDSGGSTVFEVFSLTLAQVPAWLCQSFVLLLDVVRIMASELLVFVHVRVKARTLYSYELQSYIRISRTVTHVNVNAS